MERLGGILKNSTLNMLQLEMLNMFQEDSVMLTEGKSLPLQGSLLYESLSMESCIPDRVTPSRLEEEDPAESLVHVTLTIPKAAWSGSSELTISLPSLEHLSETQNES